MLQVAAYDPDGQWGLEWKTTDYASEEEWVDTMQAAGWKVFPHPHSGREILVFCVTHNSEVRYRALRMAA